MMAMAIVLAVALAVSVVGCALMRQVARRTGFVDQPGTEAHKQHERSVPYGGGIGMGIGFGIALAIATWLLPMMDAVLDVPVGGKPVIGLIIGSAGLWLLGLIDDRRPLPAKAKLVVQILIIAGAVIVGDLQVDHLQTIPGLGLLVAIGWCLVISNAFNLLDHADGLSASTAIIATSVLFTAAVLAGDGTMQMFCVALAGALIGFLIHNWPPARLYMGDTGSLPLGFLVAGSCLQVTFWNSGTTESSLGLLAPLLVTAVPLYDTGVVIVKRIRRQQPITKGDRNHISHRLQRLGLSNRSSLAVVIALQTAIAAGALQLRFANIITAPLIIAQVAALLIAVILLEANRDHG